MSNRSGKFLLQVFGFFDKAIKLSLANCSDEFRDINHERIVGFNRGEFYSANCHPVLIQKAACPAPVLVVSLGSTVIH